MLGPNSGDHRTQTLSLLNEYSALKPFFEGRKAEVGEWVVRDRAYYLFSVQAFAATDSLFRTCSCDHAAVSPRSRSREVLTWAHFSSPAMVTICPEQRQRRLPPGDPPARPPAHHMALCPELFSVRVAFHAEVPTPFVGRFVPDCKAVHVSARGKDPEPCIATEGRKRKDSGAAADTEPMRQGWSRTMRVSMQEEATGKEWERMRVGRDTSRLLCGVGGECITGLGKGVGKAGKAKMGIQGEMGREVVRAGRSSCSQHRKRSLRRAISPQRKLNARRLLRFRPG